MTSLKAGWRLRQVAVLLLALLAASSTAAAPFALHQSPRPLAALQFQNAAGERLSLDDFHGQLLVLHLWATWCGPCRVELPALDVLQGRVADAELAIAAVSLDQQGAAVVQPFYEQAGIKHLQMYTERSGRLSAAVGVPGLPLTLLVDDQGREIARHLGVVDWEQPEVEIFLRRLSGDAQSPKPASKLRIADLAAVH